MKILVAVASKHGSANEIGDVIVDQLRAGGHEARRMDPADVSSLDGIDAVVLGSSVYMTRWMDSAQAFISRFSSELRQMPLWAFSVGLSGVPKGNVQDPSRVGPVLLRIEPREHRTFKGRLDPEVLNLRERTVARLGGAVEGDFRDWEQIRQWADSISQQLTQEA
ncbi:MAG: flavodoxin domain-containing protein [Actinomycetaceae bacterium]|nr:flavodoxin domain-containing protein [Actinomycetaceae bacterium]